jgi:hypothetical protein
LFFLLSESADLRIRLHGFRYAFRMMRANWHERKRIRATNVLRGHNDEQHTGYFGDGFKEICDRHVNFLLSFSTHLEWGAGRRIVPLP